VLFLALLLSAAAQPQVAFVRDGQLRVLNLATGAQTVAIARGATAPVAFSGDGSLVSAGGLVSGGAAQPTHAIAWAPDGETAAYLTRTGSVVIWKPGVSLRTILPARWGATSLAWGRGDILAVGRSPRQEVWVRSGAGLRRVAGPLPGVQRPIVWGFDGSGRVLWWSDLEDSSSIAADGLPLYANRTRNATTLPYPDYVTACGAVAAGVDR
jgi:hypothetical protein